MRAQVAVKFAVVVSILSFSIARGAVPSAADFPDAPVSNTKATYDAKASSDLIAFWSKSERKPADSSLLTDSNMTPSMKVIRDAIAGVDSADALDVKLDELKAAYPNMSPDAKFVAVQLLALKPLRGIVWQLRPMFEKGEAGLLGKFSGNAATHSAAVTVLRMVAQTTGLYLPTSQSSALFDYLTMPSKSMHLADRIDTVVKFQKFLVLKMIPVLETAKNEIEPMLAVKGKTYVIDYRSLMGEKSFPGNVGRYGAYGDAEVLLTSAAIHRVKHNILVFAAYNQDELMNVMGDLGKMYGVNGFWSKDLGVSTREKVEVLSSYESKEFLTLRKTTTNAKLGQSYMNEAFKSLVLSANQTKDAYDILAVMPGGSNTMLNPLFFKSDLQPELGAGVAKLVEAVKGRTKVRNVVTGDEMDIDIPHFYQNAPKNLLRLLPKTTERSANKEFEFTNDIGEKLMVRNYRDGRPLTYWNGEWQRLFPKLSANTNMNEVFRNMAYSHGPMVVLGPLSYFID